MAPLETAAHAGDITNVSGAVTVAQIAGDVRVDRGGRCEPKTHAGSIEVITGARSVGFEYEAETFKGIFAEAPRSMNARAARRAAWAMDRRSST